MPKEVVCKCDIVHPESGEVLAEGGTKVSGPRGEMLLEIARGYPNLYKVCKEYRVTVTRGSKIDMLTVDSLFLVKALLNGIDLEEIGTLTFLAPPERVICIKEVKAGMVYF